MKKPFSQRLIDHKIYWVLKSRLKAALLRGRSKRYKAASYFNSELENFITLQKTLKETIWLILGVVIFAGLLQFIDGYISPSLKEVGLKVPEDGDYVTFLSSIGGIGGVFIGLYYAALSSVGSAIYAKVPNNIRDLLAQERSGTVYMRFLSALTLLCITLVTFRVCGLPRVIVAIPIVGLLAGAGVVAFVKLGKNAFNLFDPTALSHHIFEDFNKWISVVRVNGYQWKDPAFQNHAYNRASKSIDTLKVLIEIAAKEPHQNGRPLVNLVCNTLMFLAAYENIKMLIPSDSYWYPQQFKHKDWYATAGHNVKIAHVTGTSLQPDMVRNLNWVEEQLYPDILRCLSINLSEGRHLEAMRALSHIDAYISVLAFTGNATKAFDFIDQVSDAVVEVVSRKPDVSSKLSKIEQLSVIESIATMPITIALKLAEYARCHTRVTIAKNLKGVNWVASDSIYVQHTPSYLLPQIEWLQIRIEFERLTEGVGVTPFWYQLEIMCFAEAKMLEITMSAFPVRSKAYFHKISEAFRPNSSPWLCAAIQSREHEFWYKAKRTIDSLKDNWFEIEKARVIPGLSWPEVDVSIIDERLRSNQRTLVKAMATQGIVLASAEMPSEYPDYAGQFLHITGESLLDALCTNDAVLAKELFGTYLLGCFARFEKLKPKSGVNENAEQKFRIASAAIMDLVELSGYAKLLSELHQNNDLWKNIKNVWNVLIDSERGAPTVIYLKLIFQLSRTGYALPHRSELRFDWEGKINNLLRALPREEVQNDHLFGIDTVAVHPSELIKLAAKDKYRNLPSGLNLFVVFFFINLDGVDDFELDWEQRDLLESLEEKSETKGSDKQ